MKNKQSSIAMKYFLDTFPLDVMIGKAKPSNRVEELAYTYCGLLTEVFNVFDRVIRYEKYFKDFIPPAGSGISESEAIEYHLRSYIEDFYILQERIRKITEKLIGDLPNYQMINSADIERALKHLSTQTHKQFKKITSGLRREHVHERSISEMDLVTGKFLNSLLSGEILLPDGMQLSHDYINIRHREVLNSARIKHTQESANNSVSLRKMKEWFAARFIYIFSSINGHTIKDLDLDTE